MDHNVDSNVLLVNCCIGGDKEYLARGIFEKENRDFEASNSANQRQEEQTLKVENKYYSALLNLVTCKSDLQESEIRRYASNAEAIIFSFQLANQTTFARIKAWVDIIDEKDLGEIGIKLLLATETEKCKDLEEKRNEVCNWCIENSFELIECYATDDNDEFPEKFGFDRIRESLHTHIWPNMIEKSKLNHEIEDKERNEACASGVESSFSQCHNKTAESAEDRTMHDEINFDKEIESFEDLFARLSEMKDNAKSLPDDKRKEYAEKMAIAFWKAMGLDEDEVSEL